MQSAGATVNIIGLPVTSSVVMVKTASTWVRAPCSHPRGGFSPINFVSFHVTLKALLPPGAKALPSSCASGTSSNCTKKKGRVYQKEKGRKKGADHHIKLRGLCLAQLERRGRCAASHSSNLLFFFLSKHHFFKGHYTEKMFKCSHWDPSGNSPLLPFMSLVLSSHSWLIHQTSANWVLCQLKESQDSGVADGCSTTSTHQTALMVPRWQ